MRNARLIYKKTGEAKYISHLDQNRLMIRAIKRSGIPVWYTEGFNPHIFITFALPLSLGFESEYDIMDFKIESDEISNEDIAEALKSVMPKSIIVLKVIEPVLKAKDLSFADFKVEINFENESNKNKLVNFLNSDEINVEKVSKRKVVTIFNVKPKMKNLTVKSDDDGISVEMTLPAGCDENINPMLIFESAAENGIDFNICKIVRGLLYDSNMKVFE